MKRSIYLLRSFNVLNIVLIAAAALLAARFVFPYLNYEIRYKPSAPKQQVADRKDGAEDNRTMSPLDYTLIAEQNVFHPERQIPVEKKDDKLLPKPEFVLYGVLISDETMVAYLEDKKSSTGTPGRGKRQLSLKKGDTLSGYRLESIVEDRIVMARGDDRITVYLSEKGRQRTKDPSSQTDQQKQQPFTPRPPVQLK